MEGPGLGSKLLVREDGTRSGGLGDAELEAAADEAARELMWAERSEARRVGDVLLFVDATFPDPRLVAFGAVDYTTALCKLAARGGLAAVRVRPAHACSPPRSGSPRPRWWWPRGPRRPSRPSAASTARPTCAC